MTPQTIRRLAASWLLAGMGAVGAWAQGGTTVTITNPKASEASYGEFEVAVVVAAAEPIKAVEFYVDGQLAGTVTNPPYKMKVNVGWENQEHRYRVVAVAASGTRTESSLTTVAVKVDATIEVELKQLYVTVSDGGKRVLDLPRKAFEILDQGKRQDLVTFEKGDVPLTAVVLLDSSESMKGVRLEKALEGARVFVDGLKGLDQGMVVLFADRLIRASEFSSVSAEVAQSLAGVHAEGGSAINDHLYLALKRLEAQPGRPVIVLLSDGVDVHSTLPMEEVVWKASRSQALIYWIQLTDEGKASGDTISTAWRNGDQSKREFEQLSQAVNTSGGEIIPIAKPEQFLGAFTTILEDLRSQYVLGYYPSDAMGDGSWRKVKVSVDKFGYRVRHRGGYVDN